jgi:hypothetical protein
MCGGLYAHHPAVGVLDLTDGGREARLTRVGPESTPWDQL